MEVDRNYSLRWEKHASNLATEAGYFFEDESFLDCTLSAEGQTIQAHKIILSASSSYFASLLKVSPEKHPIIIFNEMKFEQLRTLITFIYTGAANVSQDEIHSFLQLAQSLLIKGLFDDNGEEVQKNLDKLKRHNKMFELKKSSPTQREPEMEECEKSLSKLQEISFTKYPPQHDEANHKRRNSESAKSLVISPEISNKKQKISNGKYVVKSWKHNSVDDITEKHNKKNGGPESNKIWNDMITRTNGSLEEQPISAGLEHIVTSASLIEPKQEMSEEDEEEDYEHSNDSMNYYQPPEPERLGVPVPALMCKPTLIEPEVNEYQWQSKRDSTSPELSELPCPSCAKKYKSRYALNRHMLYECGKARKSFTCNICGKKVTRQDTLQKHKLIHLVQQLKEKETV